MPIGKLKRRWNPKKKMIRKPKSKVLKVVKPPVIHKSLSRYGLPDILVTTLNYADVQNLQCATLSAVTQKGFRLNSLYDPDYTNAGHQPYMRDQFAALYNTYKVISCDADISIVPSAYNYAPVAFAFMLGNEYAGGSTSVIDSFIERPNMRSRLVRQNGTHLRMHGKIHKILEIDESEYMDDSAYDLPQGNNPSDPNVAYLRISYASLDTNSQPYFSIVTKLKFKVQFKDLLIQTGS